MEANPDHNQQSQKVTDETAHEQAASDYKKSKVGLIVSIVLGLVVVALVLTTYVWSCIYHSPSKVIADATNKLFNAENVTLDGMIRYETNNRNADLQALLVTFDSASTSLPNATNVQVRAVLADQNETVTFDFGSVQMNDGTIYLQINGMIDALRRFGVDKSSIDWVYETIEGIDNDGWWRFNIAEVVAVLELGTKDSEQIEGLYSCVAGELGSDIRGEIGSLYRSNDFITVDRTEEARFANGSTYGKTYEGTDYYTLNFDYNKMAGFINGLASINTMRRIYGCVQDNLPGSDFNASYFNEVTARELQDVLENDSELNVFFEISKWGHELRHITANVARNNANITADLNFVYNYGVTVTAPDDYRPLTELSDELSETFYMLSQDGDRIWHKIITDITGVLLI